MAVPHRATIVTISLGNVGFRDKVGRDAPSHILVFYYMVYVRTY